MLACRRYDFFLASPLLGATQYETEFDFAGTHVYVSTCVVEGLRCFFIEPQNGFFAVDAVYGRRDDGMRFEFFCKVRCPALSPRVRWLAHVQLMHSMLSRRESQVSCIFDPT